jgi:hypothetical protein
MHFLLFFPFVSRFMIMCIPHDSHFHFSIFNHFSSVIFLQVILSMFVLLRIVHAHLALTSLELGVVATSRAHFSTTLTGIYLNDATNRTVACCLLCHGLRSRASYMYISSWLIWLSRIISCFGYSFLIHAFSCCRYPLVCHSC